MVIDIAIGSVLFLGICLFWFGAVKYSLLGLSRKESRLKFSRIERGEGYVKFTGEAFGSEQIRELIADVKNFCENENKPQAKDKWNFMGLEKQDEQD